MKYTIIITVYNKEKYIERCIKSALDQSYKNYEIIVVNDGSTDNSENIINKYKNKIKYYYKENTGIADTRNYAINKVKTKYFLFIDADDYIKPDLLEQVDKYDNYDVLSFDAINIDEKNNKTRDIKKPIHNGNGQDYFKKLVKHKSEFTVPWGYIYNTSFFKNNDFKYPKGKILEDFYLTPLIILKCEKLISIDYKGYYYVIDDNGIINNKRNITKIKNIYLEYYDELKEKINEYNYNQNITKLYISFLAGILIWYGHKLEGNEKKEYIKLLKQKKIPNKLKKNFKLNIFIIITFYLNIYYPIRKLIKGVT